MPAIRSLRELKTDQRAREPARQVFQLSRTFPRDERYFWIDQIRRSSRAVKSLLAEAWGHRRYPASFASKLTDTLGESMEIQSWLDDALDRGYFSTEQHQELDATWQSLGGMIHHTIEHADDSCRSAAK